MAVKSIFKRQQSRRSKLNISAPTPVQVHKPTSFATKEIRFVNPELQPNAGAEGVQRQRTLQRRAERQGTIKDKKTRSIRDYLRLPFIRLRQLIRATLRRRATIKRRKTLRKKENVHTNSSGSLRRTASQSSLRRTASTASLRRQPSTRGLRRKPSQSQGGIRKSKSTSRRQSRYKTLDDLDQVTDFEEYDSSSLEFHFTNKDMVRMHPRGQATVVQIPVAHKKITFNEVPEIIQKHVPLTPPESPKRVSSLDREIIMVDDDDEQKPLLVTGPHSPPSEFNINSEDIYARKYPSGVGVADDDSIEVTSTIGSATIEQIDQLFRGFDYDYRDKIEKKLALITRRLSQFDAAMVNRSTQTKPNKPWRHSVDSAMSEQIEAVLYDMSRDSHTSSGRDSIRDYMREHMITYDLDHDIDMDESLEDEHRRKSSTYYSMDHESDTDSFASFAPSSSGSSSYESFAPSHPVPIYESSSSSNRRVPYGEESTPLLEQRDYTTPEKQPQAPFLARHRKSPSDSTIASTVSSIHSRRAIPTTHNVSEQSFDFGIDRESTNSPQAGPSNIAIQHRPGRRVTSVAQSRESLYLDLSPSPELHSIGPAFRSDLRHEIRPESGDSYYTATSMIPERSPLRPPPAQELKPIKVRASPRQMAQNSPKRWSTSSLGAVSLGAFGAVGGESSWMKTPRPLPPVPVLSPQKRGDVQQRAVSSLDAVSGRGAPVHKRAFSESGSVSPIDKNLDSVPSAPSHPPPPPPVMASPAPLSPMKPVSIDWVDAAEAESEVEAESRSTVSGSHSSSSGNPPSPPTASDQVLQRMYRELEELQQRSVQLSDMVARTEQSVPFSDTESNRGSMYLTRDSLAVIATPLTPSFPSSFMTGPTHGTISSHSPGPGSLPTTSHTTPISRGGLNRRRVRSSVFLEPPSFVRSHSRGDSAVSNISNISGHSATSSIGLSDIPVPSAMPAPRHLVPPAEPSDYNVSEWKQAIRPPFARGPSVTRGKRLSVAGSSAGTEASSDFQFSDEDVEVHEAQLVGSRFPVLIDNSGTDRIRSVIVTQETEDE
ncbi:hypothetical protein CJU90_0447 [Yarrowia sp. C11]|nr:hypothetical protein CKK34_1858 [Yarrowia sp. E02]KAG5372794.1 hypothetical protein CJU90_0447 [Yarrowia sp. C11]